MTDAEIVSDANRSRLIAAIHALADWLRANPDVAAPHSIDLRARPAGIARTTDAERLAILDRFADVHQAERYALGDRAEYEYAKIRLDLGTGDQDTEITYTMSTTLTEPAGKRAEILRA